MKFAILIILFFSQVGAFACDDLKADVILERELQIIGKRYFASKVGSGPSMLNGNIRTTSIAVFQGIDSSGERSDRIGSISINMEKCRFHNSLVGLFDTLDVK